MKAKTPGIRTSSESDTVNSTDDDRQLLREVNSLILIAILVMFSLTGCTSLAEDPRYETLGQTRDSKVLEETFGSSVEGRPMVAFSLGDGPETVLILATIHGNESAGTPLLQRFLTELEDRSEWLHGRRLVAVPVANPDGFARRSRGNRNGVDLNRNFEADNFEAREKNGAAPLSEPESQALAALIQREKPVRVISFHQPLRCIDWDGPAEDLAASLAEVSGLPLKRLGSRPGSLGSWVGITLGVPIITVELPASASKLDDESLWKRYGALLEASMK